MCRILWTSSRTSMAPASVHCQSQLHLGASEHTSEPTCGSPKEHLPSRCTAPRPTGSPQELGSKSCLFRKLTLILSVGCPPGISGAKEKAAFSPQLAKKQTVSDEWLVVSPAMPSWERGGCSRPAGVCLCPRFSKGAFISVWECRSWLSTMCLATEDSTVAITCIT